MSEFSDATRVERVGADPEGEVYASAVAAGWDIAGNANGGYLLAIAARALADATGRPPLTITGHYLAPGRVGPVDAAVQVHRAGRRTATASAVLRSGDTDILRVLGTFAEQFMAGESGGPAVTDAAPPELPPMEECVRLIPPAENSGFGDRVAMLAHPDDASFGRGQANGRAEIRGWFQFADQAPIDAYGLLVAADAFPPVIFNQGSFPISWAPTLELTVHLRGVPAPGPLRCRFSSRFMQNGMFEEDGELWDTNGTLVAQSRQLALIPRG